MKKKKGLRYLAQVLVQEKPQFFKGLRTGYYRHDFSATQAHVKDSVNHKHKNNVLGHQGMRVAHYNF